MVVSPFLNEKDGKNYVDVSFNSSKNNLPFANLSAKFDELSKLKHKRFSINSMYEQLQIKNQYSQNGKPLENSIN